MQSLKSSYMHMDMEHHGLANEDSVPSAVLTNSE